MAGVLPLCHRRGEKFKPKLPVASDFRVRVLIVDEAFGIDTAGRRAVQVRGALSLRADLALVAPVLRRRCASW